MSCYLIRYRCSKRCSRPQTVVEDHETQSLSFDQTPCQINYAKCFATNGPSAPERDWFGCDDCDEAGNYRNLKWNHPMSREQHCRDQVIGQERPGTRRSRQEALECQAYQRPKARQPKQINFTRRLQ